MDTSELQLPTNTHRHRQLRNPSPVVSVTVHSKVRLHGEGPYYLDLRIQLRCVAMARVWMLVTALLLGGPPLISGHSYSVGKCPHFSPMQHFNWDKVGHYCLNCHQPECSSSRRGSGTSLPKPPPAGGVSRRLSRRMRMVLKVSSRYLVRQIFCNLFASNRSHDDCCRRLSPLWLAPSD